MQEMDENPQLAAEGKDAASDEEIARRLQQQLNGEAAAAARRRTRKQPTFYSPQVLRRSAVTQAAWPELPTQGNLSGVCYQQTLARGGAQSCPLTGTACRIHFLGQSDLQSRVGASAVRESLPCIRDYPVAEVRSHQC